MSIRAPSSVLVIGWAGLGALFFSFQFGCPRLGTLDGSVTQRVVVTLSTNLVVIGPDDLLVTED